MAIAGYKYKVQSKRVVDGDRDRLRKPTAFWLIGLPLAAVGSGSLAAWLAHWQAPFIPGPDAALALILAAAAFLYSSHPVVARIAGGVLAVFAVTDGLYGAFGEGSLFGFTLMPVHLAAGFLLSGLILAFMRAVKSNGSAWLIDLACLSVMLLGVFHVVDQLTGLRVVSGDLFQPATTIVAALLGAAGFGLWFLIRRIPWYQEFDVGRIDWKITAVSGMVLLLIAFAAAVASFVIMAEQTERTMKDSLALSLGNRIRLFQNEINGAVRVANGITQR
ncbi:MAG TPA: hypothetical protein VNL39_05930, partial [Xanthobacteraceae bacterium]|nr:hypothetical protein [Xanthobacteraceae bacterium]